MGAINDTRAELATLLGGVSDAAKVTDHVPERLAPPALMVVHGSPLLEPGDTFGTYRVRFEVWIVSRLAANARQTDELDALIEGAATALAADGWAIERVEQPFGYSVNGGTFLTSTISTSTIIRL